MNMVSGLFDRYSAAEWALEVLGIYGVDNSQISVIASSKHNVSQAVAVRKFMEMGFTNDEAEFYAEGVRNGGFLISIAIDTEDEYLIHSILRSAGAVDRNIDNQIWQAGNAYILNSKYLVQGN